MHELAKLNAKDVRFIVVAEAVLHSLIYCPVSVCDDESWHWMATSIECNGWHCHGEGITAALAIADMARQWNAHLRVMV